MRLLPYAILIGRERKTDYVAIVDLATIDFRSAEREQQSRKIVDQLVSRTHDLICFWMLFVMLFVVYFV